jgi:hypothetical protein
MATKRYYATGDFRYGTRMLRSGDPVDMDAPKARLYTALDKISPTKPRRVAEPTAPAAETAPKAPAKKAPARKTRKKAAAKK